MTKSPLLQNPKTSQVAALSLRLKQVKKKGLSA